MSRRKINLLIILGLIILYIFSMNTTYAESEETQAQLFSQVTGWMESHFYDYYYNSKIQSPQDYVDSVTNDNLRGSYPFVLRLYDKNGDIVARSGSYITIVDYNYSDSNDDEAYMINVSIEKYLTDDVKAQIADFNSKLKSFATVNELSFLERNGEVIPVDITIGAADTNIDTDEKLKFHLTDENPQRTIKTNEPHEILIYIYGVGDNKVDKKIYDELNIDKALTSHEMSYIEGLDDEYVSNFGGGSSSGDFLECMQVVKIGDECYFASLKVMHNLKYDTLKIRFRSVGISISIIFFIAGLILLISINRMITKNEKINSAKEAFTSAAAHELKTPISIIQNQCECIMENVAPEKNTQYIESIYDESNRMNKLVLDLLQYNRVAMATKIKKESFSLTDAVKEEVEKYSPLIEAKNIKLSQLITPDIQINANRDMLALVIGNFLSNAIKYGDGDRITVMLDKERFAVFNTGNTIDVKNKKDLWEVFYQGDASRTRQDNNSSGLGLAICKKILKLHKYKYGFNNKVNGVEFYFELS